jgi:hypothetical protein
MAGGGIPEAMLIGAAVGAGTGGIMSAAQDKDPLQGALLGAAMGAAGGGIGSSIGGLASGGTQAATQAATTAAPGATSSIGAAGVSSLPGSQAATLASQNVGMGLTGAEQTASLLGTMNAAPGSQAATLAAQNAGMGLTPAESAANIISSTTPSMSSAPASTGGLSDLAQWGQAGKGAGFAPSLTNAQAYGAGIGGGAMGLVGQSSQMDNNFAPEPDPYTGSLSYFKYNPQTFRPSVAPGYADGGITALGPQGGMYPQSQMDRTQFATPSQMPVSREVVGADYDARINPYTGDMMMASGGISHLGSYSDGGRLLKGPGDGMSDDIPASIADKQPARLADGEFVVPADVVSHLGNGSTDSGAKKLYAMMDNVRKARTGNKKQGKQIKADKYIPGMADGGIATTFQPGGYDPNYYNPQHYQSQLDAQLAGLAQAQKQAQAAQAEYDWYTKNPLSVNQLLGGEGQTISAAPGSKIAYGANGSFSYRDVGPEGTIALSNAVFGDPRYGTYKHGYSTQGMYTPEQIAGSQAALNRELANIGAIQENVTPLQKEVDRLANTSIKYDPYTTSGRPSSNEPQFYGNIYRPEYQDFAREGYNMNEQLGRWSNEYGVPQTPTAHQAAFAEMASNQRAAQQQSLENAQGAAQASRQMINASVAAGKNQPPEEGKKRGGIASLV